MMSSPNVSWDIQDQNDRIISILAWVVVVVLVLYASVYFYKQAKGLAERPSLANDPKLAQTGAIANPATPASPAASASPAAELALGVGDATRVVTHRPLSSASPDAPLFAPADPFSATKAHGVNDAKPTAAAPAAADPAPSASGYAVRVTTVYPSSEAARKALFALDVPITDLDFVPQGDGVVLQLGKFKNLDGAKGLMKKLQAHSAPAEIVSLDEVARLAAATPKQPRSPAGKKPATAVADASTAAEASTDEAAAPKSAAKGKTAKSAKTAHPAADPLGRGLAEKRGHARADAAITDAGGADLAEATTPRPARKSPKKTKTPGAPAAADDATDSAEPAPLANSEEAAVAGAPDVRTMGRRKATTADDAGTRGVIGAVATGDADDTATGADAADATTTRRKPVNTRRKPAAPKATGELPDADAADEVDASPATPAPAARRPTPRARRTSATTDPSASQPTSEEEEGARSPSGVAQEVATAARDSGAAGRFSLQVGAYSTEDKAKAVAGQLRSSGFAARVDESVSGESTVYRVRLGSYSDTNQAQAARRRVAGELGFPDVRVIRD